MFNTTESAGVYTDVDLNATGSTTLFDPDDGAEVSGVYLPNGGSTAEVDLEVTDGTDTTTLVVGGAGGRVEFGNTVRLGGDDSLQATVRVAEGTALTETAVAFTTV